MGTRSLTRVFDGEDQLVCMYRQFDGYPSGHGAELAEFLKDFVIVNGIKSNTPARAANGAGCLAAQLIAHFKTGIGGFYLIPMANEDAGQDYEYHVVVKAGGGLFDDGSMEVKVIGYNNDVLFTGTPTEFVTFCQIPESDE